MFVKGMAMEADGIQAVPLVEEVELLIPCILHLENHSNEKIITMILQKGLDLFQQRIASMQHIVHTKV
jgi:hypothetical protein